MHRLFPLFLILLLLCSASTVQAGGKLRIATEGAYPPFNYLDEDGDPAGFDVDIARALCEAMGASCSLRLMEWDGLLPGLTAGACDMVVASMARTPERERLADFSECYYRSRSAFVADPRRAFIQTPAGLADKILAGQAGTVQADHLQANYGPTSKVVLVPTLPEAFRLLAERKVDAVLADCLTSYNFLQTAAGAPFDFVGAPLPANDPSSRACIAVRKGNKELLDAVNAAIRTIRINGAYDRINRKYFPFSIY
ncbi:MAG: transporter substrate-binding domain-containing protein [Pseudodesulfovibrio sp.]